MEDQKPPAPPASDDVEYEIRYTFHCQIQGPGPACQLTSQRVRRKPADKPLVEPDKSEPDAKPDPA